MNTRLAGLVTEDWLRACPTGILVQGPQGLLWINPALERLLELPLERLHEPQGQERLGELLGVEGVREIGLRDGSMRWLRCHSAQLPDLEGGPLVLHFYQEVTAEVQAAQERDNLARQVQELTLTDALTGLANRRALGQALATQVTRSRRYHNPLTLALVRVHWAEGERQVPDAVLLSVARFLRERLRWADVIGREEVDCFMLILPETDQEAGAVLMQTIRDEATQLQLPTPYAEIPLRLSLGVVQWHKGQDGARLVAAAREVMEIANTSAPPPGE